ncbi:Asp-tRNA(Asn)/Glu-tRNA(Gln) amidotransferase subunit GatC [Weissella tructae]|jgi:aspartyl-tRNA(Asn)/glutamyl-tRNA(Gln) amidotransferase subunit C|uniref:Aspartyl/glutamyl-tRNA(Asn/Gln) amidotransferase subunit C n=2 Tax=Weissella TaxID=46255 RepID=A0A075TZP7_9LACO|nr:MULTISPECIES: Asp-tRNA(Asn)/Glu-tRNA(Gln) amidotransferase subunit GatC [Weissella]AIG65756.1 Aspartyl/glutamyl-tRNA(Asn/Gln) amidotransferase subunit C [Weissella tructae]AIM63135.1 Aspartyl/glutamyl-tRNA(Asn/Gln) amidotransferase subunit C [Weissella ceti]ELA06791.1 aspartyl/glutamyl-tRNA(Asn/Gln) amidotransferase subunit C [Weissella ceti NC36]QVV90919.1 Asp-tRNA(Asn)/Glu-tRNA(Gln) amidotransferase subunit GatC [Weissella tructae]
MNEQSLSAEEVQNVAALSKLELTAEETDIMTDHLEKIFDVVFMLEGVDTTGVKPTYSPTDLQMTLRADEAVNAGQAEELLANAPERKGDYIKVPAILEGGASN